MYIIISERDHQSRFDAWDWALRDDALGWPWGMGWGGRWERGSGWGTHVHPWLIHVNVWQNPPQYCKVISLQLKEKKKKNEMKRNDKCVVDRVILPSPRFVHSLTPRTSKYVSCCLVAKSFPNLLRPHQTPLSLVFPRQEYWSGSPFPSPGDLPDPGMEPASPALQAHSLAVSY